jgi:hypothetical protein
MIDHTFRRARGRPGADPRCGACGRRESEHAAAALASEIAAAKPASSPTPASSPGPLLRVSDVRERYFPTVTEKVIRDWIARGELPSVKVGGMRLVPEAALLRRLEAS